MIHAVIVGASGYSGAELLRLLAKRPDVSVRAVTAHQSAGKRVDELYPVFAGDVDLVYRELTDHGGSAEDIAFIALPSGEAMAIVPGLLERGCRVIDLGGDFRLPDPSLYREFYKKEHTAPHLLASAVYGLPELNAPAIAEARLVANPGCYPTSAILPLLPALTHGLIEPEGIVITSLSGVSGAGRSASVEMSFAEVNENVRAYKVGSHQHIPEIQSVLSRASGAKVSLSFVPHLIPITRGIHTTIHATPRGSCTMAELLDCYETYYRAAPFVRVRRQPPQIRDVAWTNYCDIQCTLEPRTGQIILLSVIDNLVKGAAGQAIQNMNIMCGLPQETGV